MPRKGEKMSLEQRCKIGAALKNRCFSEEHKRKISESMSKRMVLRWKTNPQVMKGEDNPNHRLSAEDVVEIKQALKDPYRGLQSELALEYGVNPSIITQIKQGKMWGHIQA